MTTSQRPEDDIFFRLREAILTRQLSPGTRLREVQICDVFSATRGMVRKALSRLAYEGLVELQPNRGAMVAQPSAKDAADLFTARKSIETAIGLAAQENLTPKKARKLVAHLKRENLARTSGDTDAIVALSGEFHLLLAEIAGNSVLRRYLEDIIARESLIIQLFEKSGGEDCADDEHRLIVEALEAGDPQLISRLIVDHIDHISARLDLEPKEPEERPLKEILLAR